MGWAQDVPAEFWRTHGVCSFDGVTYTLHGPKMPCSVLSATHTYGKQTFCSFTSGWRRFCTANELRIGDTVLFSKVGPLDFAVTKE